MSNVTFCLNGSWLDASDTIAALERMASELSAEHSPLTIVQFPLDWGSFGVSFGDEEAVPFARVDGPDEQQRLHLAVVVPPLGERCRIAFGTVAGETASLELATATEARQELLVVVQQWLTALVES